MTYGELTRRLRRLGVQFHRQGRGSHEIWVHAERQLFTVIANHRGREIKPRTLRAILKDLGLTEDDLRRS